MHWEMAALSDPFLLSKVLKAIDIQQIWTMIGDISLDARY